MIKFIIRMLKVFRREKPKPLGSGMFAGETHSKLVHPFNLPYERNNDNA